ncbi:MAG TPA: sigma-70 family RNA polymerase sigma factor [Herpetosiphonaceae bacterium]
MDDIALVSAARTDPRNFAALYERYLGPIYRYCYVRLNNRELAEDATSEIFLKALTNLPGYRDGVFAAWLFRIAQNVVADTHRRSYRIQARTAAAAEHDLLAAPGDLAEAYIERETLMNMLALLTDEQRAVLELQLAGWTTAQIADGLGKSLASIKMLRYRAVERLRTVIHQEHKAFEGGH